MSFTKTFPLKTLIALLLILTSCSSIYEPVTGNEVYSEPYKRIKLTKLSAKVYLFSDNKDPGNFDLTLEFAEIPKDEKLKLSGLKIGLVNVTTGDIAIPEQTVQFGYAASTSTSMQHEAMNNTDLENGKIIGLNGRVLYRFKYKFATYDHKHHSAKMQVKFQFNIESDGKTEAISKIVDFKRSTYLNVSGN